jgi:hypothetical protein
MLKINVPADQHCAGTVLLSSANYNIKNIETKIIFPPLDLVFEMFYDTAGGIYCTPLFFQYVGIADRLADKYSLFIQF